MRMAPMVPASSVPAAIVSRLRVTAYSILVATLSRGRPIAAATARNVGGVLVAVPTGLFGSTAAGSYAETQAIENHLRRIARCHVCIVKDGEAFEPALHREQGIRHDLSSPAWARSGGIERRAATRAGCLEPCACRRLDRISMIEPNTGRRDVDTRFEQPAHIVQIGLMGHVGHTIGPGGDGGFQIPRGNHAGRCSAAQRSGIPAFLRRLSKPSERQAPSADAR